MPNTTILIEETTKKLRYYFAQVKYAKSIASKKEDIGCTTGLVIGTCGSAEVVLVYVNPHFVPQYWEMRCGEDKDEKYKNAVSYKIQEETVRFNGFYILYKEKDHISVVTKPFQPLATLQGGGRIPDAQEDTLSFFYDDDFDIKCEQDFHHPFSQKENSVIFNSNGNCIGFIDITNKDIAKLSPKYLESIARELRKYENLRFVDEQIRKGKFLNGEEHLFYEPFYRYVINGIYSFEFKDASIKDIFGEYPNQSIKALKYSLTQHQRNKVFFALTKIIKWHLKKAGKNKDIDFMNKKFPKYSIAIFNCLMEHYAHQMSNSTIEIGNNLKEKYALSYDENFQNLESGNNMYEAEQPTKLDYIIFNIYSEINEKEAPKNNKEQICSRFFSIRNDTTFDEFSKKIGVDIASGKNIFQDYKKDNCSNSLNLAAILSLYWLEEFDEQKKNDINLGKWF